MAFKDYFTVLNPLDKPDLEFLSFKRTNELLPAVIESLKPKETDKVLSICGSGDQSFAFLEYVNTVIAMDHQEDQLNFAYERLELLEAGRLFDFRHYGLKPDEIEDSLVMARNRYFTDVRLEIIKEKLDKITFFESDIYFLDDKFYDTDIIYFSNAYLNGKLQPINDAIDATKSGTKIYMSRPNILFKCDSVFVDKNATKIAREIETCNPKMYTWNPTVFIRK